MYQYFIHFFTNITFLLKYITLIEIEKGLDLGKQYIKNFVVI